MCLNLSELSWMTWKKSLNSITKKEVWKLVRLNFRVGCILWLGIETLSLSQLFSKLRYSHTLGNSGYVIDMKLLDIKSSWDYFLQTHVKLWLSIMCLMTLYMIIVVCYALRILLTTTLLRCYAWDWCLDTFRLKSMLMLFTKKGKKFKRCTSSNQEK